MPGAITRVEHQLYDDNDTITFHEYLSETLPYFSRAKFKSTNEARWSELLDEEALLKRLLDAPSTEPVLIVTGPGGYGKSRLTTEICRIAQTQRECLAFKLDEETTPGHIDDLCRLIPDGSPVLIWIDYVETQHWFDEILKRISLHNVQQKQIIRVIANCRTSYYRAELEDDYRLVVDLASTDFPEACEAYRQEVFLHILRLANLDPTKGFCENCGYNPVLAAFILYMARKGRGDPCLIPDLRNLVERDEYRTDLHHWLLKRINRSINAVGDDEVSSRTIVNALGPLLAMFPAQEATLAEFGRSERFQPYIDVLIHDRLIERRASGRLANNILPPRWAPVHDVIADYFLVRCIKTAAILENAILEIFELAETYGEVGNVIISFQRVTGSVSLGAFPWRALFQNKLSSRSPVWLRNRRLLLRTGLLSAEEKIELLAATRALWSDLLDKPEFGRQLTTIAYSYAKWRKRNRGSSRPENDDVLVPALEAACDRDHSNVSLSAALRYNPAYFLGRAQKAIKRAPVAPETYRVFSGWIESGLELRDIKSALRTWLDAGNSVCVEAEFIFYPWLQASIGKGKMETTEALVFLTPYLKSWIEHERNGVLAEASFVFAGWLWSAERCGSYYANEAISYLTEPLGNWLCIHGRKTEAAIVLAAWFRSASRAEKALTQSGIEMARRHVENWLSVADRPFSLNACHIYSHWLFAASKEKDFALDALAVLRPYVVQFLQAPGNRALFDTERLYSAYLRAAARVGADASSSAIEFLQPAMIEWLVSDRNCEKREAEFVFDGWLRAAVSAGPAVAATAVTLLKNWVEQWLDQFGDQDRRGYVRVPWRTALQLTGQQISRELLPDEWSDRWWTFSRDLDRLATVQDKSQAARELWEIVRAFHLSDELSETEKRTSLNSLLIGSRYLANISEFVEPLCQIFETAIRHRSFFDPAVHCAAKVSLGHVRIVGELLRNRTFDMELPADRSSVLRFIQYLLTLRAVEGEEEAVSKELSTLMRLNLSSEEIDDLTSG